MSIAENIISEAVEKYGTPLYIFDTDVFSERFLFFKDRLDKDISVNFCMKANPFLVSASLKHTDRIEVCSFGEFMICRDLAIPPEKLLISGVLKKKQDLKEIMEYCTDKALYTAESPAQAEEINEIAEKLGISCKVLYRLNAGQFGMDGDTIVGLLRNSALSNIVFKGVHYFTGTQKNNLSKHRTELERLDRFFERIHTETGKEVPFLEYGTGFGVTYFEGKDREILNDESLEEFGNIIRKMTWKRKIGLEMGRALAFDSGVYVTSIMDMKTTEGRNYCILDGGIHQINYDGQMCGMYTPSVKVIRQKKAGDGQIHYCLCGSLCTLRDVLVSDFVTEQLSTGDILVFEKTGAYSVYEGMSLFLSHELPEICLYSKAKGLVSVREKQESYPLNTPKLS